MAECTPGEPFERTQGDEVAQPYDFSGALRAQRSILRASALFGLPLASECHQLPPEPILFPEAQVGEMVTVFAYSPDGGLEVYRAIKGATPDQDIRLDHNDNPIEI